MKKHLFSNVAVTMLMAFMVSFTLSSCSEEVVVEKEEAQAQEEYFDIPEGVTVFATGDNDATRTSLDLGAYFYWDRDDKIWVDIAENGTFSSEGSVGRMSDDKSRARFFVEGTLTENEYNLTYTGLTSASGTEVTIKDLQTQTDPDDAAHIATDGDCGKAKATKSNGQYTFDLHHEAHYLIFQPYLDDAIADAGRTWKLMSIEILELDGKPLSGTFNFGMDGLDIGSVTGGNNILTLSTGGWVLPKKTDGWATSEGHSWYAVIAPATNGTHRLRIRYHIVPDARINLLIKTSGTTEDESFTIVKDVDIASAPNKVTKIAHQMAVLHVPTAEFYQWDTPYPNHYWNGVPEAERPHYYSARHENYPKAGDPRYTPFTANALAGGKSADNFPCKDMPNVNALTWYVMAGDARWETEYPWCYDYDYNYIYTQGTWFKNWDVIVAENSTYLAGKTKTGCDVSFIGTKHVYTSGTDVVGEDRTYDGRDYRLETTLNNNQFQPRFPEYKAEYYGVIGVRPLKDEIDNYFFLPANGCFQVPAGAAYSRLTEGGNIHGCYWSSTAVPEKKLVFLIETKSHSPGIRFDNGNPINGRCADATLWK